MISHGMYVDDSWHLHVTIPDLYMTKTIRVNGSTSVGEVMIMLVEHSELKIDWSGYSLWWPEKNTWLKRTSITLDQYGIQSNSKLEFTCQHKPLRIVLPSRIELQTVVDFSADVYDVLERICSELCIRHFQELSLMKKPPPKPQARFQQRAASLRRFRHNRHTGSLKYNNNVSTPNLISPSLTLNTMSSQQAENQNSAADGGVSPSHGSQFSQGGSNTLAPQRSSTHGTLRSITGTYQRRYGTYGGGSVRPMSSGFETYNGALSMSSLYSTSLRELPGNGSVDPAGSETSLEEDYVRSVTDKARRTSCWLVSSRSLMEQGIESDGTVLLKFKYLTFNDVNPKIDQIRINELYEQAKMCLLNSEVACSEDEMLMFAGLQLQVQLQGGMDDNDKPALWSNANRAARDHELFDDDSNKLLDTALRDLELTLDENRLLQSGDITTVPQLNDNLKFYKPSRLPFRHRKRFWCVYSDTFLKVFKTKEESLTNKPLHCINLRGCEVHPEANLQLSRFLLKVSAPLDTTNGKMEEFFLKLDTEEQYARWLAACRLASKNKTLAANSYYDSEVQTIHTFLSMQRPAPQPALNADQVDIEPSKFVSAKTLRRSNPKTIISKILESHANMRDMSLNDAKLNYIRAWLALPECGHTYFIVRFRGVNKEELLVLQCDRLLRMELRTKHIIKAWRFSEMLEWDVNWEFKEVVWETIRFCPVSCDCAVVHEYLGGYIFLSVKSAETNPVKDKELFQSLTKGQTENERNFFIY